MPIYPRADKGPHVWTIQVSRQGKRITRLFRGTRAQALDEEVRLRGDALAGRKLPSSTVPHFADFCVREYWPLARVELAPGTRQSREYQILLLCEHFGRKRLDQIGTAELAAFVDARRKDGIGETTIAENFKTLKVILNFARSQKRLGELPRFPVVKPRGRPGRTKAWTAEEVSRLLACVRDTCPRILPLVAFVANTGCRKTEALRVRWEGVDFEGRQVWIEPVADEEELAEGWTPKDNEARPVPLGDELAELLAELPRRSAFVFTTRRGTPYAHWPQREFDFARKAAGLTGGPHTLRHTYASHFLARKPDLFLLGRILGQSQARVTELYSHLLPGAIAAAASVVQFSAPPPAKRLPKRLPEVPEAFSPKTEAPESAEDSGAFDGGRRRIRTYDFDRVKVRRALKTRRFRTSARAR